MIYDLDFEESASDNSAIIEVPEPYIPESKYEETAIYDEEKIVSDILSALDEKFAQSVSDNTVSDNTVSANDYTDILLQMNSHLEYIEEHLYEPQTVSVDTPLIEYPMHDMLLVVICIGFGFVCIFNIIKAIMIKLK